MTDYRKYLVFIVFDFIFKKMIICITSKKVKKRNCYDESIRYLMNNLVFNLKKPYYLLIDFLLKLTFCNKIFLNASQTDCSKLENERLVCID